LAKTAYEYPDWLLQKCDYTRQRCRLTTALPDTGDVPQAGKTQKSYAPGCEIKSEVRSLQTPFKFACLKKKKGATVLLICLDLFDHLSFRECFLNGRRLVIYSRHPINIPYTLSRNQARQAQAD
jgi:hypothetical protein